MRNLLLSLRDLWSLVGEAGFGTRIEPKLSLRKHD